jgi:hypothetical protein
MQTHDTGKIGFAIRMLDDNIHEFTWISPSRESVDTWMEYCDSLYQTRKTDNTMYFLHIAQSANFPPLSYVVRKARELQLKHPEQARTRSAILFQSRFFGGMINTLTRMLNKKGLDATRIFAMDERDKAIDWLLSDED